MLKVNNLEVFIKNGQESNKIINNISFNVKEKRCLGILGESGSGKSITCKAILGLLNKNFEIKGEAIFKGQDILTLSERKNVKCILKKLHIRTEEILRLFLNVSIVAILK